MKSINTLDELLWPVVAKQFGNLHFIFQNNNAPCHASLRTTTWKTENNLDCIDWPSQFPDINIIENHVWRILKIRLKRSLETIRNRDDLVREVLRIWESLTVTVPYIRDLYHTIPRRLQAVIVGMSHDAILISDFKNIKIKSHFQMSVSLKFEKGR